MIQDIDYSIRHIKLKGTEEVCPNGHPRTPENTYINPKARTVACRLCRKEGCYRYYKRNKEARVKSVIEWGRRVRNEMIDAYGAKCACPGCGEIRREFLTLDHIYGGGNKHIKESGVHNLERLAKREGYPKDKYRLLCMNCNCSRAWHGYCPHEREVAKLEVVA